MAEYRILFAQLPSPAAARDAASALSMAFAVHLDQVATLPSYRGEITLPLRRFAMNEGFAWSPTDRFIWDAPDDNPDFRIGAVGQLLVVYHAACYEMAAHGLAAFARARGATATQFWDSDPHPCELILSAPDESFIEELRMLCAEHGATLDVQDEQVDATATITVLAGGETWYGAIDSAWGIGGVLHAVGARGDVDARMMVVA